MLLPVTTKSHLVHAEPWQAFALAGHEGLNFTRPASSSSSSSSSSGETAATAVVEPVQEKPSQASYTPGICGFAQWTLQQ
jgi:hypothetical protein